MFATKRVENRGHPSRKKIGQAMSSLGLSTMTGDLLELTGLRESIYCVDGRREAQRCMTLPCALQINRCISPRFQLPQIFNSKSAQSTHPLDTRGSLSGVMTSTEKLCGGAWETI